MMLKKIFYDIDRYLSILSQLHNELEDSWVKNSKKVKNDNEIFDHERWNYCVDYPIISRSFLFVSIMAFVEVRFNSICNEIDKNTFYEYINRNKKGKNKKMGITKRPVRLFSVWVF